MLGMGKHGLASVFPKFSLAPIHEYTDAPFRLLCQRHGAKAVFVPLVNVTSVVKGKVHPDINESEEGVHVQLSGSKPDEFASALEKIEKEFPNIDGFNINAGCPSHTTMKTGAGSALMKTPERLAEIIKQCKNATSLPISVKSRIFADESKTKMFYFGIESAGAEFVIIHGRTAKQGYGGTADWEAISSVKESLSIPVVGNGDMRTISEAENCIARKLCDGVMFGRAALQNPMLFEERDSLSDSEKRKLVFEYYEICNELNVTDLKDVKLVSAQILKGVNNASKMRNAIMKSKKVSDLMSLIDKWLGDNKE